MIQTPYLIGWDIGGAHLKLTLINPQGTVEDVKQIYTPLWRGLDSLVEGLRSLPESLTQSAQHAVTMTGELADCFTNREEGVCTLARLFTSIHSEQQTLFYAGEQGWFTSEEIYSNPKRCIENVASMNWHATARLAATAIDSGMFIDIGSTTTDMIPLKAGRPIAKGTSDFTRLQTRELEYMGVIRTPVSMIIDQFICDGKKVSIARELFATMADVYRLTGELREDSPLLEGEESADGEDWSDQACARRLARLVCCDLDDADLSIWKDMAQGIVMQQLKLLSEVFDHVAAESLFANSPARTNVTAVAAGAGSFLIRKLAQQRDLSYHDLSEYIVANSPENQHLAAVCAPATACAILRRNSYED